MSEADSSAEFDRIKDAYLPSILQKVRIRSEEVAQENGRSIPSGSDIVRAFEDYMPGRRVGAVKNRWAWLNQNVTGFMAVAGILTLAFGILGAIQPDTHYHELAKLFAGALVGGAAGAAAGAPRR